MCRAPTCPKPATESGLASSWIRQHGPALSIAVLLALATVATYWPATRCGFVNFDDDLYVTENHYVQSGVAWETVKWAFANPVASNWHPLMVLSHALDFELFGAKPWGHHLTSVLLHATNAALLFLLLRALTGALWRSATVAALFAWHPAHVESVAWVAERKDVLSAFFGLLALLFYVRYARGRSSSDGGTAEHRAFGLDYGLVFMFLAFGLMSKPMLVTWPFVMLLLDWWPLRRFAARGSRTSILRLILEKAPFLILVAAASIVTLLVQDRTSALALTDELPLAARAGNALVSCCRYLGKLLWPSNLAVFYPHPGHWPAGQVVLAASVLASITAVCLLLRRRHPFLLLGWLWYCGTLVPVLGLVQAGEQAMADRYTYLPSIGISLSSIWAVHELTRGWRHREAPLFLVGCLILGSCLAVTWRQLGYWKDSEALFRHALAATDHNYLAHNNLGAALNDPSQADEAAWQFREALRLKPGYARAHNNLGLTLLKKSQLDEAISQFRSAVRSKPDFASAHKNLGIALHREGRSEEAIAELQKTLELKPEYAEAHYNLGTILISRNRPVEAIAELQKAIWLRPNHAEAHNNLGIAFGMQGQTAAAITQFQEALRQKPDYREARHNLDHAAGLNHDPSGQ